MFGRSKLFIVYYDEKIFRRFGKSFEGKSGVGRKWSLSSVVQGHRKFYEKEDLPRVFPAVDKILGSSETTVRVVWRHLSRVCTLLGM